MPLTLSRLLRAFFAAGVNGLGAMFIFAAFHDEHTLLSAPTFGLGIAIILAAAPIAPWLIALPTFLHRAYWGSIK